MLFRSSEADLNTLYKAEPTFPGKTLTSSYSTAASLFETATGYKATTSNWGNSDISLAGIDARTRKELKPPSVSSDIKKTVPTKNRPSIPPVSVGEVGPDSLLGKTNKELKYECDFTINLKMKVCKETIVEYAKTISKTITLKVESLALSEMPFVKQLKGWFDELKTWYKEIKKYIKMVTDFIKCVTEIIGAIAAFVAQLAALPANMLAQVTNCITGAMGLLKTAFDDSVGAVINDVNTTVNEVSGEIQGAMSDVQGAIDSATKITSPTIPKPPVPTV